MSAARRRRTRLGKYVVNPPVRALFRLGLPVPGTALLETTGRRSGAPRRTPVTNGLDGAVVWIVAEHGRRAAYVQNLIAQPRVRIKVGRRWRSGMARVVEDEDPAERLGDIRRRPSARLNAFVVRAMSTDPVVIRIDLEG